MLSGAGHLGTMKSYCFMGTKFLFGMMKKFWNHVVAMVARVVNVLSTTEFYI